MKRYVVFLLCFTLISAISNNISAENNSNPELLEILHKLNPSKKIKFLLQTDIVVKGSFSKISKDSLYIFIGQEEHAYSVENIQSFWVQGRATFKGTKIGAISGSITGLAFGVIFHELTKNSEMHPHNQVFIITPMLGAFIGSLLGTGIGALGTKWNLQYSKEKKVTRKKVGSLRLLLGSSKHKTFYGDYGFGGQINYLLPLSSQIAIGPELSYHKPRYYYGGGVMTFSLNKQPAPYLIIGAGTGLANYVDGKFIYSFGGGVSYDFLSSVAISVETRWHKISSTWYNNFYNIRAGIELSW